MTVVKLAIHLLPL